MIFMQHSTLKNTVVVLNFCWFIAKMLAEYLPLMVAD